MADGNMMKEKKAEIEFNHGGIEENVLITRRPIKEPFNVLYRKTILRTKTFLKSQIPAAKNNLKAWITSFRGGLILTCLVLVTIGPILIDQRVYYNAFITAMIFSIFAASWDLLCGVTGQVSFGHAAFFGIGGYACGALITTLGFHWFPAIIFGGIFAVLFGLIIAVPCLRLKGPYLALGTLAFSLLIYELFRMNGLEDLFWGEQGIIQIFPFLVMDIVERFLVILIFMIVCVVIMLAIFNSRLGTIFQAIRDDEVATEAAGIHTTKYKLIAFMISSFFAGIAGALYVLYFGSALPFIFLPTQSFYPVIMTLLGGVALISGSVLGAYMFWVVTIVIEDLFVTLQIDELLTAIFPAVNFSDIFAIIAVLIFSIIMLLVTRFTKRGLLEPAIEKSKSVWDLVVGK